MRFHRLLAGLSLALPLAVLNPAAPAWAQPAAPAAAAAPAPAAPASAVRSQAPGARLAVPALPPRVVAPTDQAQWRRFTLDNGIRVILVSDPRFNRSAASLVVDVGQIDDPGDAEGLAHFTEHMLFLGTAKYPEEGEYSRYIRRNGGSNNAYTASDHTNYQFDVRHEALPGALDRFAQFFIAPSFNPTFVGREVNAVHNEAMRHVQNDFRRTWSALREVYHPDSGERKFSTGNKDTLARATPEAVRAFFERHYSANRMALAIAGRAPLDELERLARLNFTAIPQRGSGANVHTPIYLPRKEALRLLRVEPVRELRQLQLEFLLPPTRPMFAGRSEELVKALLETSAPGGLLATLRAEGLANNIGTNVWERTANYSALLVILDLTPQGEKELAKVMNHSFAWFDFLRRQPFPTAFHADRARIGNLKETFADRGEGMGFVTGLANNALFYPLEVAERAGSAWGAPDEPSYRELLSRLVPENMIAAFTARGVKTDRRERIYDVAYSYEENTGEAYQALKAPQPVASFALPGANRFMPSQVRLQPDRPLPLIEEPGLALHYLPDGEFQRPETAIVMRFVPVRSLASADNEALLTLWSRALAEALDADLDDARAAGVTVQPDAGFEGVGLTLTGYGDAPARVARHLAERMRSFSLTPERFAAVQEQVLRGLASFPQTEAFQMAQQRREAFTRQFRMLPDQIQAKAAIATWPEVQRFGQQLFARGRVEMLVHGHLSPEDATATARAMAASLGARAAAPDELMRRRNLVVIPGEHIVDAGLIQGVNAAWISEYVMGEDNPRLRAASLVLSAYVGSQFSEELRTRQQLGYIVGSTLAISVRQRGLMFIIQSSTHATPDIAQRAETFVRGLPEAMKKLSDAEWAQLVAGARSNLEQRPKSILERAQRMFSEAYTYGGDWGRNASALQALETLKKDEATALLAELLDPAKTGRRTVALDPATKAPAAPLAASFTDREAWKGTRQFR
jgi:secreted Zn-dependent insulinase-like peptidase